MFNPTTLTGNSFPDKTLFSNFLKKVDLHFSTFQTTSLFSIIYGVCVLNKFVFLNQEFTYDIGKTTFVIIICVSMVMNRASHIITNVIKWRGYVFIIPK